jgi:hypothetical protein
LARSKWAGVEQVYLCKPDNYFTLGFFELLVVKAYHIFMKFCKRYLILCLLFVMPLQGIAASFQLACQDNHKTSMVADKKMSHCHQNKEHNQSKEPQNDNTSHHCLSFCAQSGMSALTHNAEFVFQKDSSFIYIQYSYHYDSVILPHIQRPPISFS